MFEELDDISQSFLCVRAFYQVFQWGNVLATVVMSYYLNVAHSVRMRIAVSSSFWSSQNSQIAASAILI